VLVGSRPDTCDVNKLSSKLHLPHGSKAISVAYWGCARRLHRHNPGWDARYDGSAQIPPRFSACAVALRSAYRSAMSPTAAFGLPVGCGQRRKVAAKCPSRERLSASLPCLSSVRTVEAVLPSVRQPAEPDAMQHQEGGGATGPSTWRQARAHLRIRNAKPTERP
jgi:hypothetical protein